MTILVRIHLRWMIRRDMDDVARIETASFPSPWGEESFLEQLRREDVVSLIAEVNDRPVGYLIYELRRKSLHVLRMAVDPDYRGRGVGTRLVDKLKAKIGMDTRRDRVTADVADDNTGAQLFLRACGFLAVAVEREGCKDTGRDLYRMAWSK